MRAAQFRINFASAARRSATAATTCEAGATSAFCNACKSAVNVLNLRAEAFNVFNHANFVGYSGTYGNGNLPGAGFGQPLSGITNQLPARSMQFSARLTF